MVLMLRAPHQLELAEVRTHKKTKYPKLKNKNNIVRQHAETIDCKIYHRVPSALVMITMKDSVGIAV